LPLAGRIVDLHREKRGSAVVETAIEQRVEMRVVAAGRRLLLAGDLIDAGVTIGCVNG
jgi:hypothetical protein